MKNPLVTVARSLFAWPLIHRELVTMLRTTRSFWLLVASVGFSTIIPLMNWPKGQEGLIFFHQNLWVFTTFMLTQLTLALLIIPAFTAGAIAGERQNETYDLLYSTLLVPSAMIVSKIIAATTYVLLLLLASAPGASLLYMLGGLDFGAVLSAYAVLFASVISSGIVCLTVSMRSDRTTPAAVRSYIWVAFWSFGVYLLAMLLWVVWESMNPGGFFSGRTGGGMFTVMNLISSSSPFVVLPRIVFIDATARFSATATWEPWLIHVVYCTVIGALHFLYLLRRVRMPSWSSDRKPRTVADANVRTASPSSPSEKPFDAIGKRKTSRISRWVLNSTEWAESGGRLGFLSNPIFRRELLSEFPGSRRFRRFLFWVPVGLCALVGFASGWDADPVAPLMVGALVLQTLVVPGVAATSITREREQGNIDLLRGTTVPMANIVHGKILASFFAGLGPICAVTIYAIWVFTVDGYPHLFDYHYVEILRRGWPLHILAKCLFVLFLTTLFLVTVGTLFSVVSRKSISALVKTYAFLGAIFVLFPIVFLFGGAGEGIIGFSPFATMAMACFAKSIGDDTGVAILIFGILFGVGVLVSWAVASGSFEQQELDD